MGLIFSKIWALFGNEEHKIVIVGLDNAGKTTILYQLIMNEVVQTSPTIGSNVEEVTYKNIHFVMWDLGGQQSLRQTWTTYFINVEFVILVVDSTDSERLTLVRAELDNLMNCDDLQSASFLILANKQDVKSSLSPALISRELNLDKYKSRHWQIQPCCALTGEGLTQGLEWIVSRIKR
jgi:small GTP-binding protein